MGSVAAWIGLIGGIAAAAQIFATVSRRIARAKALHEARLRQLREVSREVREKAKSTLDLRREERQMEKELMDLSGHIDVGEQTVQRKRSAESLLYVLDERRNQGDQPFVVPIRHPRFADLARNPPPDVSASWAEGRRYLVWAVSAKMAGAKAAMRCPADRGFTLGPAEPFQGRMDDI